ncbi:MAG: DNA repair protein RadA [Deltaproteobacteria bacterium]
MKIKTSTTKSVFFCQSCGSKSFKWLGKCPACGEWNTFAEELIEQRSLKDSRASLQNNSVPQSINAIIADEKERLKTGVSEVDRVLGGGIVNGSAILIGGEPGIGKSTLLLQIMQNMAANNNAVLYVSGEESAKQIKLRGERIGANSDNLLVFIETDVDSIIRQIAKISPAVVVIDSIQTIYTNDLNSAPGSISQIREASDKLIVTAKKTGVPLFFVGHVTKDGSIAGPKVLEHMVDTVLYFEGDANNVYRIVRSMKNRFGPTNEIGVFEMQSHGLKEISNPSDIFLAQRPKHATGSVVVPSIEGTRPILLELQALVSRSNFGISKRTAIGFDPNRASLLVAVLDKFGNVGLGNHDIFINVAGGIKVTETAADLGIISALLSSFLEREIESRTALFGEVGLSGEVRGVSQTEMRIKEASRMGFSRCIIPKTKEKIPHISGVELIRIESISELSTYCFA